MPKGVLKPGCETVGPWPSGEALEAALQRVVSRWALQRVFGDDRQVRYKRKGGPTITAYKSTLNMHVQNGEPQPMVTLLDALKEARAQVQLQVPAAQDRARSPDHGPVPVRPQQLAICNHAWPAARERSRSRERPQLPEPAPFAAPAGMAPVAPAPASLWAAPPGPADQSASGVETVGPWPSEASLVGALASVEHDWGLTREHESVAHQSVRFQTHGGIHATITAFKSTLNIHVQGKDSFAVLTTLRASLATARAAVP